ncbi:hypothetical protein GW916_05245 [bacterium]|nr:hypothetical protein [bacterium]
MNQLGQKSENEIAKQLEGLHWSILARSQKIAGIECDIIASDPMGKIWILEVKYRRHASMWGGAIISKTQFQRQLRALQALRRRFPHSEVNWALIWRKKSGGVEFVANPCYF